MRIQVRASSQTKGLERGACEASALRPRKSHTQRFTDFFTDFEVKTDCFAVQINTKKTIIEDRRQPPKRIVARAVTRKRN